MVAQPQPLEGQRARHARQHAQQRRAREDAEEGDERAAEARRRRVAAAAAVCLRGAVECEHGARKDDGHGIVEHALAEDDGEDVVAHADGLEDREHLSEHRRCGAAESEEAGRLDLGWIWVGSRRASHGDGVGGGDE